MAGNKTVDLDNLFTQIENANKEWFGSLVAKNSAGNVKDGNMFIDMYKKFFDNTKSYLNVQQRLYAEQIAMWQHFFYEDEKNVDLESPLKLPFDKRFTDKEWDTNPFFAYLKTSYLTMSHYLVEAIAESNIDDELKERVEFFMRQYLDAISPTNFPLTNPEVIKNVVETGGVSLVEGMKNMLKDMHNGYISMTDESLYTIGKNIAATEGVVIFKNQLIELIQYKPKTINVRSIPLLIVPPCINKYYILDLQEKNSFVKYLVECGYTVFLVSWKSADQSMVAFSWEEYVELGIIKSIDAILEITGVDKINTIGYCIGGIILNTAYLVMQDRGTEAKINTISCVTTMLDHAQTGDIKFFIDRDLMKLKNITKNNGGIVSGRTISQVFSVLRANELIWNYWINNYLLGKTPQPFDILFWNNDTVDLPALMHTFLLKNMYLENQLVTGTLKICDVTMDLAKITCPMYLFATQKDHIVPWESAYKTVNYVKGNVRFVLGASGHTAGVINSVSAEKRNYWVNEVIESSPELWFEKATELPGSWWKDFNLWLKDYSGVLKKARKTMGNKNYNPICDAPGEYVFAKSMNIVEADLIV